MPAANYNGKKFRGFGVTKPKKVKVKKGKSGFLSKQCTEMVGGKCKKTRVKKQSTFSTKRTTKKRKPFKTTKTPTPTPTQRHKNVRYL